MHKPNLKKWTKKKKIIVLAVGVVILLIVGLMVKENIRHHRLATSMDSLAMSLRTAGFSNVKQSSGCGSGQGPYGPTGRSCSTSIDTIASGNNLREVNLALKKFSDSMHKSQNFTAVKPIPAVSEDTELSHGYASYRHSKTQTNCTVDYDYDTEETLKVRIGIWCDDSSWFSRTFLSGW